MSRDVRNGALPRKCGPVKVTIVGGGSSYTPELVDGVGRLRDLAPVSELVLHDPDRERLEAIAGISSRILARHGWPGRLSVTDDLARAVDGADFVLLQLRVGGQAARQLDETHSPALRLRRPGDDGRRRFRQGAAHGAGRARHRRRGQATCQRTMRGSSTSRTPSASSPARCSTTVTVPSGCATWRSASSGCSPVGSASSPPRCISATPASTTSPGSTRSTSVATTCCRCSFDEHGEQLADHVGLPLRLVDSLGAVPSYYLRYFYQHDVVVEEQRRRRTREPRRWPTSSESCSTSTAIPGSTRSPPCSHDGAAPSTARRRFGWSAPSGPTAAMCRSSMCAISGALPWLPDDAIVEVPCRIHRSWCRTLPPPELAPEQRGLVQHVAAYERLDG